MTLGRHFRRTLGPQAAALLAAAFLGACATTNRGDTGDEGIDRIDEIIAPEQRGEPIPEGIALGQDAPPLAGSDSGEALAMTDVPSGPAPEEVPPEVELETDLPTQYLYPLVAPSAPCAPPPHGAILPAPVPLSCLLMLNPGAIEYRIEPRPGGSIPGLLP